jgi:uncharacterized phiE125 gp8 family phage protein
MTIEEMRVELGLGPEVADAQVVDAWVRALDGLPPADEPVSLAEARAQLSMTEDDPTDQDGEITNMIKAARELVEGETGLILTRRQVAEGAACFGDLTLNAWPVASVDAINYIDTSGAEQSLAVDAYRVQIGRRSARILPPVGGMLPAVHGCGTDAITIVATAGFETPDEVPEFCKRAILIMVSTWFRTREDWTMPQGVIDICQRSGWRYR